MRIVGALLLLAAGGCSSPADLTCEYLLDPANCWADTAASLKACLPAATEIGVLAPDRATCSFSDGTRIVFDAPLPADNFELEGFGFTIEKDGAACGSFVDTFMNRMEMEAGGSSAVSELHPGGDFHLHCGNGDDYESDFDLLFTCPGGTAPTDGFEVTPDLVRFLVVSVNTPGDLFQCAP